MGASILMAEYYGAKKYEDLKEEMATSIGAGLLLTLVLSLLFYAGSGLFIRLTQTPEEISHMAAGYLRIISAGLIFTFFYNILAAALRAIGDSRTSLCVLILTTIINVVLDIIFVRNLDLGVYGAAWATVIAQAVSSLALILYIYIKAVSYTHLDVYKRQAQTLSLFHPFGNHLILQGNLTCRNPLKQFPAHQVNTAVDGAGTRLSRLFIKAGQHHAVQDCLPVSRYVRYSPEYQRHIQAVLFLYLHKPAVVLSLIHI